MIIWLASYPRSGNTYFRILLNSYYGINTYSLYDDQLFVDRKDVGRVVGHQNRPSDIQRMADNSEYFIVKTHSLPEDDYPAIYLVRDGRDSLVSYAHYILTYEQKESADIGQDVFYQTLHDLIVFNASFGGWGPNVLAWSQRTSPTAILKFEDLVNSPNPLSIVKRAMDEIGYSNDPSAISDKTPSFGDLHNQMPKFFREGKVGGWQDEMPEDLHNLFWEKHGDAMRKMEYAK